MKPKVDNFLASLIKEKGDSDQEMLNLENDLYSLTHYADDEEELVAQMFATVKGSKLEAMMPPILKEIPLIDVQQLCLHELRGMSKRRILSIINGQEMSGSSSEEDSEGEEKLKGKRKPFLDKSLDDDEETEEFDGEAAAAVGDDANLTALDLLELEMRAKLIKTMLGKQDGDEDGDASLDEVQVKQEPMSAEEESPQLRGRKHHRRRRKSHSRCSSYSDSSYVSRSESSRSRSSSRSGSPKKSLSGSPTVTSGATKKRLTRREFSERMQRAKKNRSYRGRDSDEEKRKDDTPEEEEGRKKDQKEEEPQEMEEGEIDSVEGSPLRLSGSDRSRSRSSDSYSSSSSSSSGGRSRRSKGRRGGRRRRRRHHRKGREPTASPEPNERPKVPNWPSEKEGADVAESLPSKETRQSVSFSFGAKKKSLKANSEVTGEAEQDEDEEIEKLEEKEEKEGKDEGKDDFYKGVEELDNEGEIEEKKEKEVEVIEVDEEGEDKQVEVIDMDGEEEKVEEEIEEEKVEKEIEEKMEEEVIEEKIEEVIEEREEGEEEESGLVDLEEEEDKEEEETVGEVNEEEEMEIIGTIEPTDALEGAEESMGGGSWSTRWLQSDKVQKVVSNSKMLSKVRKNIQAKGKPKPVSVSSTVSSARTPSVITTQKARAAGPSTIGSIEEYEKVIGIKVKAPTSLPQPKGAGKTSIAINPIVTTLPSVVAPTVVTPTATSSTSAAVAAALMLSDDDDDSEEEALWSTIMKK